MPFHTTKVSSWPRKRIQRPHNIVNTNTTCELEHKSFAQALPIPTPFQIPTRLPSSQIFTAANFQVC
ncbi:hypothetical protein BGZ60DRAFT_81170 [Tricladium varicosporioides]|nr:hypothetical protein BGZ60DRAFT_81170 [Hymenoscyphus varicosporioides]